MHAHEGQNPLIAFVVQARPHASLHSWWRPQVSLPLNYVCALPPLVVVSCSRRAISARLERWITLTSK